MGGDPQIGGRRLTNLGLRFSVVQVSVLPVEPGMAQFMGKNVTTSRHREAFSDIDRLGRVIPDSIRIRIPSVHLRIG